MRSLSLLGGLHRPIADFLNVDTLQRNTGRLARFLIAERKAGELLQQLERAPHDRGNQHVAKFQPGIQPDSEYRTILTENEIAPTTAHRWQYQLFDTVHTVCYTSLMTTRRRIVKLSDEHWDSLARIAGSLVPNEEITPRTNPGYSRIAPLLRMIADGKLKVCASEDTEK